MKKLYIFIFLSIIISSVSHSHNVERENIRVFINYMVNKHGFKEEHLIDVLKKAESKESILEAISRPAERTLTWNQYRDIFIKKERINAGVDFWVENKDILERICDKTGVDIEIMLGIIGVETYFGRITGGYRVIDALSTLAFDYPKRSPFFTRELESFLLIVREEEMDPFNATGSYAGAMGSPQFMPSSYRAYAIAVSYTHLRAHET